MITNKSTRHLIFITSSLTISLLTPTHAATISLNHIFSDDPTSPLSTITPWLTITTVDTGEKQVSMEFKVANLTDPEYIKEWYFNVNDSLDLNFLSFTQTSSSGQFDAPTISKSTNFYQADSDGKYDVLLTFSINNSAEQRFTRGDTLIYTVEYTGSQPFNSSSFDFLSDPVSGNIYGPFQSAAKVNTTGTDGNGSAWIAAVPEPTTALYSLLATGLFFGFSRKRK